MILAAVADLDDYRRKRDFTRTSEPAGATAAAHTAHTPRFVVQRHDARALHFDLRLEIDGVLASWAVPKGVPLRGGQKRLAVQTEPHPLEYLDFAGTIPAGEYGAGRMSVWDRGTYRPLLIADDEIKVELAGGHLRGEYHLVRTGGTGARAEWLLFRAAAAGPGAADPRLRFRELRPMLAVSDGDPFDDPDWSFEIKWDGYRALVLVSPDGCEIRSRTGRDMTATFPRLADLRRAFDCQEAVVDGEICVLDDNGRAVFHDLQAGRGAVTYVVFDLLQIDGDWLLEAPYAERRERLQAALVPGALPQVMRSDDVVGEGRALFAAVAAQGGEGVVAKRRSSPYVPGGRVAAWRKLKVRHEMDVLIGGWVPGEGSRRTTFGALVVGRVEDEQLVVIGRVGSGFSDAAARDLRRRLDRLAVDDCPFVNPPADALGARWVRPAMECRVSYTEITPDGVMRTPVFLGMAEHEPQQRAVPILDLSWPEVRVRDGDREVRLTNLDKPFWKAEGITKGDLLDHYARMAQVLVPHLADRPMILKRYPNGWDAPHFFQHAIPDTAPDWIRRVSVTKSDDTVTYAVVDDALGLLWLVNLGCIDLNPWHSRVASLALADYVLFDFDPQDGVPFDAIAEAALLVREELAGLGLRAHVKTSGSRGLHVLVPIAPAPHEATRLFAQLVAQRLVAQRRDLVTTETVKARRGVRIYIDANQNGSGKTIASVYSVRPVPGATVSTPVSWDELAAGIDPGRFTIAAVAERVARQGDLFAGVLERDQDLAAVVADLGG